MKNKQKIAALICALMLAMPVFAPSDSVVYAETVQQKSKTRVKKSKRH